MHRAFHGGCQARMRCSMGWRCVRLPIGFRVRCPAIYSVDQLWFLAEEIFAAPVHGRGHYLLRQRCSRPDDYSPHRAPERSARGTRYPVESPGFGVECWMVSLHPFTSASFSGGGLLREVARAMHLAMAFFARLETRGPARKQEGHRDSMALSRIAPSCLSISSFSRASSWWVSSLPLSNTSM
jgi:hypothetical protein